MVNAAPFSAAGIGEILWDMLPEGPQLGGAPANFAYHFQALGGIASVISRIGDDELGRSALNTLTRHKVNTSGVTVDALHPTGRVDVTLDSSGVANYSFPNSIAWDYIEANPAASALLPTLDVVCFGSLAQRNAASRSAISTMLGQLKNEAVIIFDVNLRQEFYSKSILQTSLEKATVLKINEEELSILAQLFDFAGTAQECFAGMLQHFSMELGALTLGERGSLLMTPTEVSKHSALPVEIVDTIGAGDSFTAAIAHGWLRKEALEEIHHTAASLAAYVCSQKGAMPPLPHKFLRS